jgi:hypothetical protein
MQNTATVAHVVSFKSAVEQIEGIGMRGFEERVVPVLRELEGLCETLVLLDRAAGEHIGITLWDTQEHARTAAARLEVERQRGAKEMDAESGPGRLLEVQAHLIPAPAQK